MLYGMRVRVKENCKKQMRKIDMMALTRRMDHTREEILVSSNFYGYEVRSSIILAKKLFEGFIYSSV